MPLGQSFGDWLKEQGKEPLSSEVEKILDDIGDEISGDEAWQATVAAGVAKALAVVLQQEYKMHKGRWWLWSLGKPARPLTDNEIKEHGLAP